MAVIDKRFDLRDRFDFIKCQHECVRLKLFALRCTAGAQSLLGQDDMSDSSPIQELFLFEICRKYLNVPECDLSGVKALYRRCIVPEIRPFQILRERMVRNAPIKIALHPDISLQGVQKRFSPVEMLFIRFQQHIPAMIQ